MTSIPDIDGLLREGTDLHAGLALVLTFDADEQVKYEIAKRKRYRITLRRAKADLSTAIAELQRLKRDVENADGDQAVDIEELDDYKWELIRGVKDVQSPHSTDPSVILPAHE